MSKNEIFSWGFKGGYQPTQKNALQPLLLSVQKHELHILLIYKTPSSHSLVKQGGGGGRLDNLAAAFSFAKCSIAS